MKKLAIVIVVVVAGLMMMVWSLPKRSNRQPSQPPPAATEDVWSYSARPTWAGRYPGDEAEAKWLREFEQRNMPAQRSGGTPSAVERVWASPNSIQVEKSVWRRLPEKDREAELAKWQEYFRRKGLDGDVSVKER